MHLDPTLDTFDPDLNYLSEFQNSISCNSLSADDFCMQLNDNTNMFNIVNYNVRSFRTNIEYFLPLIEKSNIYALVLTETWFSDAYQGSIVNYNSYHTIRSNRQSGGVSVFVDKKVNSHNS